MALGGGNRGLGNGLFVTDSTFMTSMSGVFAAGAGRRRQRPPGEPTRTKAR